MRKTIAFLIFAFSGSFAVISCKKESNEALVHDNSVFDSAEITGFFAKYPDFKEYKEDINELYKKHQYHYIWFDKGEVTEFADAVYNQVNQISTEGIPSKLPYKEQIDSIFYGNEENTVPDANTELLLSSMYFFYAKKVYQGLDTKDSKKTGWFLPREKMSYVAYLDTLMKDPKLLQKDISEMIPLYYNLKKGLQHYRDIDKKGGWKPITMDSLAKPLQPGDSAATIAQVRERLFVSGELGKNSKSPVFDTDLLEAVKAYEKKNSLKPNHRITPALVQDLNIPVEERIKTIMVNMERCRWISPDFIKDGEYIAVNIPSFRMRYVKKGKLRLESNVVVGKEMNKTVVFSGKMSYLVFSPYWNLPKSIIEKEVKPGMQKDRQYLEKQGMEWNNGLVRQKPGPKNSLGLVKFMFPNSNNIYLHDTPSKGLFNKESRALSHGCVRVEKAAELANAILEEDRKWTPEKISEAMNGGKEMTYPLQKKIPVYIAYFTATADEEGNVSFYEDVYQRDGKLATLLYND
ncbi:L,D-transpeptidase family protein [Flavobacterium humi]|uniref:L,D-transpeptidase n=1 Tax=Flavobacterium humi TaxID=2562683 RepID=A0A4Z0L5Q7_9FLAO|nr:L,D-transpeptidase family protein [Flavobacterium humi]TGD57598.1 L,D-transpeptidase [Flavobacterium humi]